MVIEHQDHVLLIDPMIGAKGTAAPPFSVVRFKPLKNPTLDLPKGALKLIEKTTHCLITHLHADHLDKAGISFLKEKQIPVTCSVKNEKELSKKGLNVVSVIDYWKTSTFLNGSIEGIPARHGYGFVAKPMGYVMGYFIKFQEGKSLYLSSDTVFTSDVSKVLHNHQPDISVVACGSAQLDVFQPLLMTMTDIIRFVNEAPSKVICNHLEAVNHCPTTREDLRLNLTQRGLLEKTWIPRDGEFKEY
jgi:L-ascorbate metabolism protein UlaG (beta-lactamase superfamily)